MQTDEEIKNEFEKKFEFNSWDNWIEAEGSDVEDWWLAKFHTLQEEYKKEIVEKIKEMYQKDRNFKDEPEFICDNEYNQAINNIINIINNK